MDVVGVGELCLDFIAEVEKIPDTNGFSTLLETSWQGGGKVPTAMVALSRLGASAGIISIAGDDKYGRFCMKDFAENGVDTSHMVIESGASTNFCICLAEQETRGRSYIGKLGSLREITADDIDCEYVRQAKYLHIWQINEATGKAIDCVRKSGGKVVIDADRYSKSIEDNLEKIDVFVGSEYYYNGMFGQAKPEDLEKNLKEIQRLGPEIVVITFGEKGSVGIEGDDFFRTDAFTNIEVRDTTGAGDVFHGAFIYGLLQGWEAPKTARFASAVSAIKCTAIGGRAGIPDRETTEKFIESGQIDISYIHKWEKFYEID